MRDENKFKSCMSTYKLAVFALNNTNRSFEYLTAEVASRICVERTNGKHTDETLPPSSARECFSLRERWFRVSVVLLFYVFSSGMILFSGVIFLILGFCLFMSPNSSALRSRSTLGEERSYHRPNHLHGEKLDSVSSQVEDLTVFKTALKNILVPRVVGTESHRNVQNYIINEFSALGWQVEEDSFTANTPIGNLPFKNIVATHNPQARRFLDFACHYDSKYYPGNNNFVGATDSAVPCAMMIHMAHALHDSLEKHKRQDLSLRFIFFDGEEAFRSWSKSDSLYGARHLARKWQSTPYPEGGPGATQLDRIDMLVLLDLLGARNPEFYSFFPETQTFYKIFANAETKLSQRHLLRGYSRRYFHKKSTDAHIEDDHLPFLERDVPIVHIITVPFPREWHTAADNRKIVDFQTTQNLIKIMSVFITEYMSIPV